MAEALQDFLISVRYQVDAASQNNFLSALKKVAGSVAGVAAEIAGLAGAVLGLTKTMADTGDSFYWMSQRVGSSVGEIKSAAFAMGQLGESSEQALGNIEKFGAWTRNMGPAATAYLRSLGVTATDTTGRLNQLAEYFRQHNAAPGSMQFALNMRQGALLNLDPQTVLGMMSGRYQQEDKRGGLIRRLIWGVDTQEQADAAAKKWADQSNAVMTQFRDMALIFDTFRQKFALQLFDKVLPQLKALNQLLIDNKEIINTWIRASVAGLGRFISFTTTAIDTFSKLPDAVKYAIGALALMRPAMAILSSPIARLILALSTLLEIIQDYQVYHRGGLSLIDWGKFDEMFTKIGNVAKSLGLDKLFEANQELAHFVDCLTGIPGLFNGIEIALLAVITKLTLAKGASLAWKAVFGGSEAEAAKGFVVPAIKWLIRRAPALAMWFAVSQLHGDTAPLSPADQAKLDERNRREAGPDAGKTPEQVQKEINERHGYSGNAWDDTKKAVGGWWNKLTSWPGGDLDQVGKQSSTEQENLGANIGKGIVKAMQDITGVSSVLFRAPGEEGFGVDEGTGGKAGRGGGGGGQYGAGTGGLGDPDAGGVGDPSELGLTPEQFKVFRDTLGGRESGNHYRVVNSYGYAGKYQFGTREIAETAKSLGEPVPSKAEFLGDPALQERFFLQYTVRHYRQMMGDPAFAKLSPIERAGYLATGHLKGVGGAIAQLHGGSAGSDAYGTTGASYSAMMTRALYGARLGVPAGGVPTAKTSAPVQNNHTTVNVAAGPTAEATGSRVTSGMQYLNQQRMRQFSDIFR